MIIKKLFYLVLFSFFSIALLAKEMIKDYCVGYFEEVYWALDPIEDEEIRGNISNFFDDNFSGAKKLNYNLYYDSKLKQFIQNEDQTDKGKYIEVNYPNFEIMILDAYINLFMEGDNYCPAFWDNCSEESLEYFFEATTDFSNNWIGEENVLEFLEQHFLNHQCLPFIRSSINKENFIQDLNILIFQLTQSNT
tara:strand:- start:794 stop:1372 length:579 start_codon:yes stop_codon:yes gene_type:complete